MPKAVMWDGTGDWTTWDGLSAEVDESTVVFGAAKQPAAAGWKAAASSSSINRVPTSSAQKKKTERAQGFQYKAIDKKKKKAPRAAGLMSIVPDAPEEMDDEAEDIDENVAPSPYITSKKNAFAMLGDIMDAEEAEAEAEAAAAAAKAAAEAVAAKKKAVAKPKSVVTIAMEAVEKKGLTPVARRTRTAFRGVSETLKGVVDAVSPYLERSRSVLAEKGATATNMLFGASAAESAPAAKVTKKAAAPPTSAAAEAAPVRRSSRLRTAA